ncbi:MULTISPECIES: DUF2516 family protein [Actinoplanes]|uniref:DUF2516 family protein n=1 Tax=Actinoplanes TaxID=1865 RepID=UPI0005F2915A|nr:MULTISPECIES: DUF2516 family protein [Actinoplanes]GLY03219.1 hypothetical protein Acsp01_35980 [Actinoplanes sp. NBRC 101535]
MATSTPIFFADVRYYIDVTVFLVAVIVQAIALIHCLTQRGPGFQALGTLPKGAWAAIIAVCLVITVLTSGRILMISMIGIAAALIYLLDVRPGLKDLSDGKGLW